MSTSTIGIPYPLLRPDITSLVAFKAIPTVDLPDGRKLSFTDADYSYEFITVTSVLAEDSPRIVRPDDFGTSGRVWVRTSQVEVSDAVNFAGDWLLTPAPPANEVVINSLSDFAVQDGTTITLEDNKTYVPGAPLVTSKRFIVGKNVAIFGSGEVIWEYTGTGAMFTGVDVELFNISNFSVKCTGAEIFNLTDTTPVSLFSASSLIAISDGAFTKTVDKFGTFNNIRSMFLNTVGVNCDSGITITGATLSFLGLRSVSLGSFSATFVGLDLGSTIVTSFFDIAIFAFIGFTPGSIGISGLTNSGNVSVGLQANLNNCNFIGAITPLVGLAPSDLRIQFRNSSPIPDSTIDFFSSMTASETVAIGSIGEFVPIAGGNWATTKSSRWSVDTDGVATYLFPTDTDIQVTANASLTKVGGSSNNIAIRINVDTGSGFPVPPPVRTQATTDSSNATNVTSADIVTISEGDRVRIEVANMDATNDVVVSANARFMSINGF